MNEAAAGPSSAMISAMSDLWRLRPPGPDNILAHPAFERLREVCRDGYPNAGNKGPGFALSTALRALGLPCDLRNDVAHLALSVEEAAKGLDTALRATHAKRVHLAPLDLAADLPPLAFGSTKLCRLTAEELRGLVDERRLKRFFQRQDFDAGRFAQFHWLVVEETVPLEQEPEARAVPVLYMDLSQDLGRIEPHKGRFPGAVEKALFFLLLAPWESWATMKQVDWRGFRVPWIYTVDSDIFVRPNSPPSPDTLNWEERIYDDGYGGTYEEERPVELRLEDAVEAELPVWDQSRWTIVEQAKRSVLFETPIVHFLVRAFLAEGVDEFLAHITTIEAALGLRADYDKSFRFAPDRHKGMSATRRMRGRLAGLLGDRLYADQYERLFNVRSAFLHGRAMTDISTEEQVMARSLARQVVEELILATSAAPVPSREDFLDSQLDKGAPLI
ncbi:MULTISPECIES: hypothetical protein [unclassified Bradyrhizobium]|uniref:hypothetical protein n=1 Tax=Bradyrhizobium sp. USDA 4541 TaxID=2817704 RepID=UPI0020A526C0|nr:hypothetical protein [Bradyrhizobium sp. USDA 4541]MCP1848205.1 hypothetical protein [Bradyrhizobium sp. USDA 4541]